MSRTVALTVTQLTQLVRSAVAAEARLESVMVEGELSNLRIPASGHMYFTLRDSFSSLRCVCFRTQALRVPFHPQNGMALIAHGRVDVYEQDGSYQLYVDTLQPSGLGAMALAVEQLARRLAAEGLFDESRKRTPPLLPRRIAVVTSPTGAAVRDVCTVIRRRAPGVGVVVVPTPVQGDGAAAAMAFALTRAQRLSRVDVVLLVRGGGSLEDLWAFQDETLARAIRASALPVITGIGHETDTTIADHAADRRAPTPSAAAMLAAPDAATLREDVATRALRLRGALHAEVAHKRRELDQRRARLAQASPERRLAGMRLQLDARAVRLRSALLQEVAQKRRAVDRAVVRLSALTPAHRLPLERERLQRRSVALETAVQGLVGGRRAGLATARARLEGLSPRRVLQRGYSITLDGGSGMVVRRVGDVRPGQRLRTLLAEGEVRSVAEAEGDAGDST